jgi:hypothetical protein
MTSWLQFLNASFYFSQRNVLHFTWVPLPDNVLLVAHSGSDAYVANNLPFLRQ